MAMTYRLIHIALFLFPLLSGLGALAQTQNYDLGNVLTSRNALHQQWITQTRFGYDHMRSGDVETDIYAFRHAFRYGLSPSIEIDGHLEIAEENYDISEIQGSVSGFRNWSLGLRYQIKKSSESNHYDMSLIGQFNFSHWVKDELSTGLATPFVSLAVGTDLGTNVNLTGNFGMAWDGVYHFPNQVIYGLRSAVNVGKKAAIFIEPSGRTGEKFHTEIQISNGLTYSPFEDLLIDFTYSYNRDRYEKGSLYSLGFAKTF